MARIRTHNRRRRRARRREVYRQALEFHEQRCLRLQRSGNLDLLRDSGFVRRKCKRIRGFGTPDVAIKTKIKWYVRDVFKQRGLDDDLGNGGPMHHMFLSPRPEQKNY